MGLIRNALGSALGTNQVNNGFGGGGPRPPSRSQGSRSQGLRSQGLRSRRSSGQDNGYQSSRQEYGLSRQDYGNSRQDYDYENARQDNCNSRQDYDLRSPRLDYGNSRKDYAIMGDYPDGGYPDQVQQRDNGYGDQYSQPPQYSPSNRGSYNQEQYYDGQSSGYNDSSITRDMGFRPLALPQIAYGDGQPFVRGYSNDLVQYNISPDEFIQVLDTINVAMIPSPENQIFQKGANIAGWFLPGAASIGLTVGQLGMGIGSAVGHSSILSHALLDANLKLFVPNGLEICIGKSTDVDAEVGITSNSGRSPYTLSSEERQGYYGDLIAPLSRVLPPLQQSGRSDPIAMLGRGLTSRESQKKQQKAEKGIAKGKTKDLNSLEGGLKWLIVRRASADALMAYRQQNRQ